MGWAGEQRGRSAPPCPRGFAGTGRGPRRLAPVPFRGASASRRGNAGARPGAGRETPHPPSLLTAPRAGAGCALRPRRAPAHRGPGGGGGSRGARAGRAVPPVWGGSAGLVRRAGGQRGAGRGRAGQGRGDWGARAGDGELFSAVGEALRQARAAAACGPERLAARRGWGGPGACPGCASQPVRSSRLLSYGANPPKLGAQIP